MNLSLDSIADMIAVGTTSIPGASYGAISKTTIETNTVFGPNDGKYAWSLQCGLNYYLGWVGSVVCSTI